MCKLIVGNVNCLLNSHFIPALIIKTVSIRSAVIRNSLILLFQHSICKYIAIISFNCLQ